MKLHLGCGERYLNGYFNIDFPLSEHSVQNKSVADLHADILSLKYESETVAEIRLHHVFEHFTRPVACALLASWFSWLKPGGKLHIEVPDFKKTASVMINPFISIKKKLIAERHLYGTHEAPWAVHCEGYTPELLSAMVENFGYKVDNIKKNSWMGTHNFELFAQKKETLISRDDLNELVHDFLGKYLLDDSEVEQRLLKVWLNIFMEQINKGWAN